MNTFNGTIRRNDLKIRAANFEKFKPFGFKLVSRTHEPKANRVDEVRMWPSLQLGHMSDCEAVSHISSIARRPVSALWTTNYTTDSSTEAMNSGNRYYWKVRALDGGGEQ